jgi:hypothetical protein
MMLARLGLRADEVATSMISTGVPARCTFAPRGDSERRCRYREKSAQHAVDHPFTVSSGAK